MAMKQDIKVSIIVIVGTIGILILVLSALMVQGWYYWQNDKITAERYQNARDRDLVRVTAEQRDNLARLGYADETRATAALPIDRAIDLWLAEHGNADTSAADRDDDLAAPDAASGGADPIDPVLPPATRPAQN